ncbi:hypothetical protein [Enterococcus sp. BWR-S5]|uniref:hypothetical protein n=1 Tax=Enterococcus sp. BWR-S5 TaxID=2787714 RepID=UPI0019220819|nr:hypothetical protein [Enterococcus sp. BWR-S5]MBL1226229.1 hypothetical protein [Enterococcus sp. BWR-S5]
MNTYYRRYLSKVMLFSSVLGIGILAPSVVSATEIEGNAKVESANVESTQADYSSAVYEEARTAYELAEMAKNQINLAIADMNTVIADFPSGEITQENLPAIDLAIADWTAAYESAKVALDTVYHDELPVILAYQEKNELYNDSGTAPIDNIVQTYSPESFSEDLEAYIQAVEADAMELIEKANAYKNFYEAHDQFLLAFDEYTIGWKAGNAGDPNDDYQNTWQPTINVLQNFLFGGNFDIIGYSDSQLQSMTTLGEWEEFVAVYESAGNEAITSANDYAEYLNEVSNTWAAAKEEMEYAVADFNVLINANVILSGRVDPLSVQASGMIHGMSSALAYNLASLRSFPFVEWPGETVYRWLSYACNAQGYQGLISGQSRINTVTNFPEFQASTVSTTISPLEVYELSAPDI